jgi:hypothetical protein
VHLRPWQPGDERAFVPRPDMAAEGAALAWDWSNGPPGPTWSLIRWPAQVIGVGGGRPAAEPGVYQVWACLEAFPRGDWALAILCASAVIRQLERAHGARRLTVLVRKGVAPFERTMERLGFTRTTEASCWPGYLIMAKGR